MPGRFCGWIESIIYVGLKPGAARAQARRIRWLGPLRQPLERFLERPAPGDPLYLSNRSLCRRIAAIVVIAAPCILLLGVIALMINRSRHVNPPPPPEPTPAEVAARLLPNLEAIKIESSLAANSIEVSEVRIDRQGGRLIGALRNKGDQPFRSIDLIIDVLSPEGSHLGAVKAHVDDLSAAASKEFQAAIPTLKAQFAIVREIHAR